MSPRLERTIRCYAIRVLVVTAWLLPIDAAFGAAPTNKLQALVNETATQVQLSYRQHPAEQKQRQDQIAAVIAAWRTAERSEANNQLLTAWLHAAILSSMPGSREPLPPAPSFAVTVKVEVPSDAKQPTEAIDAQSESDPFRDDPETDSAGRL